MGLFDFLKSKPQQPTYLAPDGYKQFLVDNIFYIQAPDYFEFVESDRFRLKNADETKLVSITNWAREGVTTKMTKEDLKSMILPLYKKYIEEGGFEAFNDLETENDYISQSFKVDDETQYYLTTNNIINGRLIISGIIMRTSLDYSKENRQILKEMQKSIKAK